MLIHYFIDYEVVELILRFIIPNKTSAYFP